MKIRLTVLFVLALANTSRSQSAMTLQECIDYALNNNAQVKNAHLSHDMSKARVKEFLADGFPQVSAYADLGNNFKIPTTFIPAQIFDPTAPEGELVGVQFGSQYNGRATVDLTQMIFSGSYFVGLKATKTYTELSRKDLAASEIDVMASVKKAYYSVLVNQDRLSLVGRNFGRLDSLLRQTKLMYENGFAEKIDVNRVQVSYNNILNAKRNAELAVSISYELLKFQMGMPVGEQLLLSDNLTSIELQVLSDDYSKDFAYSNRVEYSKMIVNQELVGLDIKNTSVQYLPKLDFYGTYGASYGTSLFDSFVAFGENWRSFGTYGVRLSVPIFDGLRKSSTVQQKRLQERQIENSLGLLRNQIDMERSQALATLDKAVEVLESQKENMDLAEEVFRVSNVKYQQGVGSNMEVIDADASYKEAQSNYISSLFDALMATVDVEKAHGRLVPQSH
jgi:outer membrane protein TolC